LTGLLFRTLIHYEPSQLTNYVLRRISRPSVDNHPAPKKRLKTGRFVTGIERPISVIAPNIFRLLNVEHAVTDASDWNSRTADKLWLYTLHYHEWLSAGRSHVDTQRLFLSRWLDENAPRSGIGWEAYPISVRILHWIKWLTRGEEPVDGMLDSLAAQTRFLMRILERHLGANHLFANAIALTASGVFFEGQEAEVWLNTGLEILRREFAKQFLADGGHFELSPSYHALLLESILDIENLTRAYGIQYALPWENSLPRLFEWLAVMTRPDGSFWQFNDCAQDAAPSRARIEAYAKAIGINPVPPPSRVVFDLPDSGYTRLRNSEFDALFDAGPFAPLTQPGHGHCDMLSFELSFDANTTIVNGGTSTYERSARRHLERSTSLHNTVQIPGHEQTEIWSAFRAGRTARIVERTVLTDGITASHDGFRSMGALHKRAIRLVGDQLTIVDEIQGRSPPRSPIARIHFAPGIVPEIQSDRIIAGPLSISTRGAIDANVKEYQFAPEFNRLIPAKVLEVTFKERLETIVCRL
jgi:uncharacterized heparinase superfamily protein